MFSIPPVSPCRAFHPSRSRRAATLLACAVGVSISVHASRGLAASDGATATATPDTATQAAATSSADPNTAKTIEKVLKTLITAIRYKKDDLAAAQIGFATMAQRLLAPEWPTVPDAQRSELIRGIETLVRKVSFKKGHDIFEYLDAVLYAPARVQGNEARCTSTVVVHRSYKKTELVIEWVLAQEDGRWKVIDTVMLGESTLAGLREDQIEPLLEQGGVAAVLTALRTKLREVAK